MTETVLNVSLKEVQRLRIVCQKPECGAVMQLSLARLTEGAHGIRCPGCNTELLAGRGEVDPDAFQRLARATLDLCRYAKHFAVEIPVHTD